MAIVIESAKVSAEKMSLFTRQESPEEKTKVSSASTQQGQGFCLHAYLFLAFPPLRTYIGTKYSDLFL